MTPIRRLIFLILGTLAIAACAHRAPIVQSGAASVPAAAKRDSNVSERPFWSDTIRQWSTLSRGWNRIPGRFATGCAHDTIYAFKVRPGLTDKVMIFLNGGGVVLAIGAVRSAQAERRHVGRRSSE